MLSGPGVTTVEAEHKSIFHLFCSSASLLYGLTGTPPVFAVMLSK